MDELHGHGMGREPVVPDWPPLTLDEVAEVLDPYGLRARSITWSSPRPFSAAAVVATGERPVFVKRHASVVRDPRALAEEHAFADHLRRKGLPLPQMLTDRSGRRARSRGPWTYEVQAVGSGDDLYRDVLSWEPFASTAHAEATGEVLARIAAASADYAAPARPPRLLTASWSAVAHPDLLAGLAAFIAARPLLTEALRGRQWRPEMTETLVPLHEQLVPHLPHLASAWTHGDGHPSNFLWQGDAITAVLDLGLSDRTTPLVDLATALERGCIGWLDPDPAARPDLVDALLGGWGSVRPLSAQDRAALAAVLPLAHVEFALSELAYFTGVTGSTENAHLAYDGYLLGHARWFAGPAGADLLSRIRG